MGFPNLAVWERKTETAKMALCLVSLTGGCGGSSSCGGSCCCGGS